ncbi:MAG TPA: sensor histidine kinase [Streptosporangiaceae bacterium]|jgi:anti-sigma regulatory factor (Ser/Thr protein kinase)
MATASGGGELSHRVLFYRDEQEYLAQIAAFARGGLAQAEAVFVALPGGRGQRVSEALNSLSPQVSYADMAEAGRNPARIIPQLREFIETHPGRRVRFVSESAWPGRSAAELREAARHEALTNLAFDGAPLTIMCLYDRRLAGSVIDTARRTHPAVLHEGQTQVSAHYAGPSDMPPDCDRALPPPPGNAAVLAYRTDLRTMRDAVTEHARRSGLSEDRTASLVLAVSELAANTLRHTSSGGTLHIWRTSREILCQVRDQGWIADPLAGRTRRPATEPGHGLWVVNQVCDLVELRTGPSGTTFRLHMRLPSAGSGPRRD